MPYEVSFDEDQGIVNVRVSGTATRDDHYGARDEAFWLCQQNGCSKLLVDLRELDTSGISTTGCFTFGVALSKTAPEVRIAHVMPANDKSSEDVEFTSSVAANRGKSTGEFKTVEEARKWLNEST